MLNYPWIDRERRIIEPLKISVIEQLLDGCNMCGAELRFRVLQKQDMVWGQ